MKGVGQDDEKAIFASCEGLRTSREIRMYCMYFVESPNESVTGYCMLLVVRCMYVHPSHRHICSCFVVWGFPIPVSCKDL